jgi:SnoaL-like domain
MTEPESTLVALIEAFAAHDAAAMRATLADDLTGYITTADGGVEAVHGADEYVGRLLALQAPTLRVTVTQSVTVTAEQALAMVEIYAERKGRTLHNFAAFLAGGGAGRLHELWMVEALPAYSDEFWRSVHMLTPPTRGIS